MPELVIFDIDNTLVRGQSQQLLISYLYRHKRIRVLPLLRLLVWFLCYQWGIVQDPKRALAYALKFLRGQDVIDFEKTIEQFYRSELSLRFYQEGLSELRKHQAQGRTILLASNAIEPLVKVIANHLGVHYFLCTRLELKQGKYTGNLMNEPAYGKNKQALIQAFLEAHNMHPEQSWGYGDHESDSFFLENVTHPYAVNPDTGLRVHAKQNNWPILVFK